MKLLQAIRWAAHLLTQLFLSVALGTGTAHAENTVERIEVSPDELTLSGDRDFAQVLVTGYATNDDAIDLTRTAEFSPTKAVDIDAGYLRPTRNGTETLDVRFGDVHTQLKVTVTNVGRPKPISFRWDTLAILTKQGCNSGACHGKPNGRGALELSLNAFDPKLDERSLVRGSFARFTTPLVPEQSLMLKKPTLALPHGGGKRLRTDDEPYEILRRWIDEGCRVDPDDAPTCIEVQVEPNNRVIRLTDAQGTQQLRVIATFSDGTTRDVTRLASYTLSDEAVAKVSATGFVSGQERGQTAIVVRYLDDIVSANLTFVRDIPGFDWKQPSESNYVDRLVHQKLQQLQYQPSETCDDATFLRRLSLDVRGLLPTAEEAQSFLANQDRDKRKTLIDHFLESPEYGRSWGLRMADLLRINREAFSKQRAAAYSDWVFDSVKNNMPYDQFVIELLTATGSTSEVPPANFFRVSSDTKQVAETVSQLFMGSRIMCAQCHNHPYESWTQDNYYQIGSAFHEIDRILDDEKKKLPAPDNDFNVSVTSGRVMTNPRTGIEQQPWPTDVERETEEDNRLAFARWLTSGDNKFFARVAVNRIWAYLMGRGIVEPVDDFRSSNPPVNPELLDALAADFVASGFDREHIIRTVLNSQTYQRSSNTNKFNAADDRLFSHARTRLLSAEAIQDAITRLCDGDNRFTSIEQEVAAAEAALQREDIDDGAREELHKELNSARERLDTHFMTQQPYPLLTTFLKAFGQPERKTACACERREEVSLDQALQLMNSELIRQKVGQARHRFAGVANDELAEQLYLSAFSRLPRPQERNTVLRHVESTNDRGRAIEDIVWALINTNEFLFQH